MYQSLVARAKKFTAAATAIAATGVAGVLALPASPAAAAPGCKPSLSIFGTTRTDKNVHLRQGSYELKVDSGFLGGGAHVSHDKSKRPASELAPETAQRWEVVTNWCGVKSPSSVEIGLKYRIYDRNNQPTSFWVNAYFRTPAIGFNSGGCTITNEEGGTVPYTCGWSNFGRHDWDAEPILDIKAA